MLVLLDDMLGFFKSIFQSVNIISYIGDNLAFLISQLILLVSDSIFTFESFDVISQLLIFGLELHLNVKLYRLLRNRDL